MIPTLNPATAGGSLSLPEFVTLAAQNGFSGVEFDILAAWELGFERAAALFEGHKVLPVAFGLPVEWRQDEAIFQAGMDRLAELSTFAQDIGSARCCTWVLPASVEAVEVYSRRSMDRFAQMAKVLADNGIRLGLEFIGPHHFRSEPEKVWFYDIAGALEVADTVNSLAETSNVGLLVDSFHWHTSEASAMDLASIPLEQIVHVHINDAPLGLSVPEIHDSVRELPGATGIIDLLGFLTTLNGLGYDGPVAVETFSEELRGLPAPEAGRRAGRAMSNVLDAAGIKRLPLL